MSSRRAIIIIGIKFRCGKIKSCRGSACFARRKVDKLLSFSCPLGLSIPYLSLSFSSSVRLFSLRRGARYPLFDKSTSISSLREHQLQDSSRDINLLSGRNVISRAIDTLVAPASNTKTIAPALFSLINKKGRGERTRSSSFWQQYEGTYDVS